MSFWIPYAASLLGRIGAHVTHARHDSRTITEPGRAAFLRRFEDEVDPRRECRRGTPAARSACPLCLFRPPGPQE